MNTRLINFLGSPGSGKTTLGSQLFAELKILGYDVEFVTEFVKTWTYTDRKVNKYGQYYIFGKETENQQRLFNKVDFIIADSPVLLTAFYQEYYWGSNSLIAPCHEFYNNAKEDGIETYNIYVDRKYKYNSKGRFQTEEESNEVHKALLEWLPKNGFDYFHLKTAIKDRIPTIMDLLKIERVTDEDIQLQ